MSNVPASTYHLFDQYKIPANNDEHFVCPRCGHTTGRNRRRWINHFKQRDSREFSNTLDCIRAINNVVQTITEDNKIQSGALDNGLHLHLNKLIRQQECYRLTVTAADGQYITFKSITSITLDHDETVNKRNSRHSNTILLEINY